jgi:PAS domain S-box-containing protein
LRVGGTIYPLERYLALPNNTACAWAATFGAAAVISVVYFVAAWLGLVLRPEPAHMAVFWPASGIAVGILIIAGRRASLAVCMGVMVGGVAATIFGGRGIFRSALLAGCNAGEVILFFWFLSRWVGGPFGFSDVREVVGFLLAASIAAAISGAAGAAILASSVTPYLLAWETWLPSHVVGIVVVAPLLFALDQLRRYPPSRGETAEALAGLVILVLASLYAWSQPAQSWLTFCSTIITLPPLLWLAARCRPAFAIAGASISSSAVICTTIFGIGRFGDESVSITDRVHGAQTILMMVMVSTLVLTALFAALKRSNELLRSKEAGFRQLLEALPAAIQTTDTAGRITYCNQAAVDLWGVRPEMGRDTLHSLYRLYYQDGTPISNQDEPLRACQGAGEKLRGQDLVLERTDGKRIPIISSPSPLSDEAGGVVGAVQMYLDISERKRAEEALAERNIQLGLAAKSGLVGSYSYDTDTELMQISAGYAAIHGFPEGTAEIARSECLAGVHPDDIERVEQLRGEAFRECRREYNVEYRLIRPGGELRWVETRCFLSFSGQGHPRRVVGVSIDISERKQVEEKQRALLAELDHRVKNALSTVSAVVSHTWQGSRSVADFVAALDGRIRSMTTTHELLSFGRWEGVSLTELVRRELAPYATHNNTEINGPGILLKPEAGQAMAMVLHELATNAAKYGALSAKNGRVSIRWHQHLNGHPRSHLVFEWQEIGGPPVVAVGESSYGTNTIRDLIPYEFGGTVDLVLARDGVRCRLELPSDWLGNDRLPFSETGAHHHREP